MTDTRQRNLNSCSRFRDGLASRYSAAALQTASAFPHPIKHPQTDQPLSEP